MPESTAVVQTTTEPTVDVAPDITTTTTTVTSVTEEPTTCLQTYDEILPALARWQRLVSQWHNQIITLSYNAPSTPPKLPGYGQNNVRRDGELMHVDILSKFDENAVLELRVSPMYYRTFQTSSRDGAILKKYTNLSEMSCTWARRRIKKNLMGQVKRIWDMLCDLAITQGGEVREGSGSEDRTIDPEDPARYDDFFDYGDFLEAEFMDDSLWHTIPFQTPMVMAEQCQGCDFSVLYTQGAVTPSTMWQEKTCDPGVDNFVKPKTLCEVLLDGAGSVMVTMDTGFRGAIHDPAKPITADTATQVSVMGMVEWWAAAMIHDGTDAEAYNSWVVAANKFLGEQLVSTTTEPVRHLYMITIPPATAVEWKGPQPPQYTDLDGLSEFFSLPESTRDALASLEMGKAIEIMMGLNKPLIERVG